MIGRVPWPSCLSAARRSSRTGRGTAAPTSTIPLQNGSARRDADRHRGSSWSSTCAQECGLRSSSPRGTTRPPRRRGKSSASAFGGNPRAAGSLDRVSCPAGSQRSTGSGARRLAGALARVRSSRRSGGLVLGVWWIVAPAHIDDGWIWPQNRIFADLGAVTFYFDFWGVTAPLGYWLTWLGHWAIGSTTDLIVMRLPVLAVLVATWLICRASLRVALGGRLVGRSRWVLAAAFLVGSTAWGMTIRPEPTVAVLALVSLWAVLAFEHSPRTWLLAVGDDRDRVRDICPSNGRRCCRAVVWGSSGHLEDSPERQGRCCDGRWIGPLGPRGIPPPCHSWRGLEPSLCRREDRPYR